MYTTSFSSVFAALTLLFVLGCVAGWCIEVLFRRIFSAKRWVNPGFMIGPYLPLYGFGVMTIFLIFITVDLIPDSVMPYWGKVLLGIAIVGVCMTLIELIAGLIFIKGMGIKLWDYSKKKFNFKGIICLEFSIIWLVAGALFYCLLLFPLASMFQALGSNPYFFVFPGIVLGIMLMDFGVSLYYSKQVKKFNNNADMRYDDLKISFRHQYNFKEKKNHFYGIIDISSDTATTLPQAIEEFEKNHPDVNLMSHYDKQGTKETKENPFAERKDINKKED